MNKLFVLILGLAVFASNSIFADYWLNTGAGQGYVDPYVAEYQAWADNQAAMYNAYQNSRASMGISNSNATGAIADSENRNNNMINQNQVIRNIDNEYEETTAHTMGAYRVKQANVMGEAQTKIMTECLNGRCGREIERQMQDDYKTDTTVNKFNNMAKIHAGNQQMQTDMFNETMKTKKFKVDSYYDWIGYSRQQQNRINYDPFMPQ